MKPLSCKIEGLKSSNTSDYVITNGMSSLVKYFFKNSDFTPSFQKHVDSIKVVSDEMIEVSTQV